MRAGYVVRCPDARHAVVKYMELDGDGVTLPTRFLIPTSGAVAKPTLRVRARLVLSYFSGCWKQTAPQALMVCCSTNKKTDRVDQFVLRGKSENFPFYTSESLEFNNCLFLFFLQAGDYVLARVVNQDTGLECYVPGVVQVLPRGGRGTHRFYTLVLYTGQQVVLTAWCTKGKDSGGDRIIDSLS